MDRLRRLGFDVEYRSHAEAILRIDFPEALAELDAAMQAISIPIADIVRGGGGESVMTQALRRSLALVGWNKHVFNIRKLIDGAERESISHQVDHVRQYSQGTLALEIEWNNKDPFFDRDLENFKRLHVEGAISVGIIVTRGASLQARLKELVRQFAVARRAQSLADLAPHGVRATERQSNELKRRLQAGMPFAEAWAAAFCADKFGQATTHWAKLQERLARGIGNPCPILLIGIPDSVVTP